MPYKDPERGKAHRKEYYRKNKEKIKEKQRIRSQKQGSMISIGEVFYKLTVVDETESYRRTSLDGKLSSRRMWVVRCECGNEFKASGTKLRRGDIVMCNSCACKLRPQSVLKYTGIETAFRKVILHPAKKRGIEVSIPPNDFAKIAIKPCHYCGAEPQERPYMNKSRLKVRINGIDRVSNAQGYTLGNCVPCCKICNTMKSTLNKKEFIEHIQKIFLMWGDNNEKKDEKPNST